MLFKSIYRPIYQKLQQLASHRHAVYYLMGISFLEAFCLPLTPLFILIPMVMAVPQKKWLLVSLATASATVGSCVGYYIGYQFIQVIYPWIVKIGYSDLYSKISTWYIQWDVYTLFASIVTIIPFELFTILSGVFHAHFIWFIITVAIVRGIHFAGVVMGIHWFAKPMLRWLKKKYE